MSIVSRYTSRSSRTFFNSGGGAVEIKASQFALIRASWSDGTTVAIAENGDAILIPRSVAGDLYGELAPGTRVKVDAGDDKIATSIQKA